VRLSMALPPVENYEAATSREVVAGVKAVSILSCMSVEDAEREIREKQRIERFDSIKSGDFHTIFADSMIMGDSHAEGLVWYKLLGQSRVAAVKGRSILSSEGDVSKVINTAPRNIFINYGMNDAAIYGEKISAFIDSYRGLITELKQSLPEVNIYICSVFQAQEEAFAEEPYLVYIPQYNEALKLLAEEMGVNYIDTGHLLTDEYYEPDHIHTNIKYHKLWLNYIADSAGLLDSWEI